MNDLLVVRGARTYRSLGAKSLNRSPSPFPTPFSGAQAANVDARMTSQINLDLIRSIIILLVKIAISRIIALRGFNETHNY
jgi:hypothetical protein